MSEPMIFKGAVLADGGLSASADEAEVHTGLVFVPAGWREALGFGQDD